jgi:hypothetical protein
MANGTDWATIVQAAASVIALALAVFMPGIQKAAERRESGLAIVRTFKLSIREINTHVMTMGDVLWRRHSLQSRYGIDRRIESVKIVLEELDHVVESQTKLMNSVGAVDLPVPGMAVMGTALRRSFLTLKDAILRAAKEHQDFSVVIDTCSKQQKMFYELVVECDRALDKVERDMLPNPTLQRVLKFVSRLRSIN